VVEEQHQAPYVFLSELSSVYAWASIMRSAIAEYTGEASIKAEA
jgi:hypothetical protein